MTLQTIEVEVDATGHLRALEPDVTVPAGRALLTLLTSSRMGVAGLGAMPPTGDWRGFVGVLRDSPVWSADPRAIQETLRDDWR